MCLVSPGILLTLKIKRQIKYTLQLGQVGKNNTKTVIIIKEGIDEKGVEPGFDITRGKGNDSFFPERNRPESLLLVMAVKPSNQRYYQIPLSCRYFVTEITNYYVHFGTMKI